MHPQAPHLLATNVVQDGIIPKNFDAPADIQASYKKHKQYMESMESHYVEEYEDEPEAYDVSLCIDDFQDPKRLKTQEHETGDYE